MKIVEEDHVDWEPLSIRFVAGSDLADDRRTEWGSFLKNWFRENSDAENSDCAIRYWNVEEEELTAFCEHLTGSALERLATAVGEAFPEVDHARIGTPFEGIVSGLDFKWIEFPAPDLELDGEPCPLEPFAISKFQISVGQFTEFTSASGYLPDWDMDMEPGYLVGHMKINWGANPKIPIYGVTFNDAAAYCEWARVRLPTEAELRLFFVELAGMSEKPAWSGDCWTTTVLDNGHHWLVDEDQGPSHLPPDYYDYPFPVFRVAKSLEKPA